MTITSKVTLADSCGDTTKYPALYKSKSSGAIVLAMSDHSGVVVCASKSLPMGGYYAGFEAFTNMGSWERVPIGTTVTLTQE